MTRVELQKELGKIDNHIDVLEVLMDKTKCNCVSMSDTFYKNNAEELTMYKEIKALLKPLCKESDEILSSMTYHPFPIKSA
jgi:hypothetical protein